MYKYKLWNFFNILMIRYLIPIIFLLTILFSSLFFDYWNFVFKLTVNNLSELLIFVENKFLLSLMFFTILYLVSTALYLPIGTFLTFLGGYIFGVFIGFFLVTTLYIYLFTEQRKRYWRKMTSKIMWHTLHVAHPSQLSYNI